MMSYSITPVSHFPFHPSTSIIDVGKSKCETWFWKGLPYTMYRRGTDYGTSSRARWRHDAFWKLFLSLCSTSMGCVWGSWVAVQGTEWHILKFAQLIPLLMLFLLVLWVHVSCTLVDTHERISEMIDEVDPYKKPRELLEVSPKGLVPGLRFNRSNPPRSLNESTVIMDFLQE